MKLIRTASPDELEAEYERNLRAYTRTERRMLGKLSILWVGGVLVLGAAAILYLSIMQPGWTNTAFFGQDGTYGESDTGAGRTEPPDGNSW